MDFKLKLIGEVFLAHVTFVNDDRTLFFLSRVFKVCLQSRWHVSCTQKVNMTGKNTPTKQWVIVSSSVTGRPVFTPPPPPSATRCDTNILPVYQSIRSVILFQSDCFILRSSLLSLTPPKQLVFTWVKTEMHYNSLSDFLARVSNLFES